MINSTSPAVAIFHCRVLLYKKKRIFASRSHMIDTTSLCSANTKAIARVKNETPIAAMV